jgi:SAM-dependent methyltransferase
LSLYARDLAYVHDAGFGDFARDAGPGLLRLLAGAGLREGLVVDLGCGSGIWAEALTAHGFEVLGLDVSEAMLEIARARAPKARFDRGSAFDAELPRCVAVTAIGECLGYLPASGPEPSLPGLFGRVRERLEPGGLLVFDLAGAGREPRPRRTWHAGRDWVLCLDASEDPAGRELVRRITVFRETGGRWRRSDESHRLRLHEPAEVLEELVAAGFEARRLRGYGRVRFPRGWAGFAAVRRP